MAHAFTQYREGAEQFRYWRRFRTQFEAFGHEVEFQECFFKDVIRDLVFGGPSPLSIKGTSEDEIPERLKDMTDPIGQSGALQLSVKLRLGDRYEGFIYGIQHINGILEEFNSLLRTSEVNSYSVEYPRQLQFELY